MRKSDRGRVTVITITAENPQPRLIVAFPLPPQLASMSHSPGSGRCRVLPMSKKSLPGIQIAVSFIAVAFLAFVLGAFVVDFKWWPYTLMFREPFEYLHAVGEQKKTEAEAAVAAAAPQVPTRVVVPASEPHRSANVFMTSEIARP